MTLQVSHITLGMGKPCSPSSRWLTLLVGSPPDSWLSEPLLPVFFPANRSFIFRSAPRCPLVFPSRPTPPLASDFTCVICVLASSFFEAHEQGLGALVTVAFIPTSVCCPVDCIVYISLCYERCGFNLTLRPPIGPEISTHFALLTQS